MRGAPGRRAARPLPWLLAGLAGLAMAAPALAQETTVGAGSDSTATEQSTTGGTATDETAPEAADSGGITIRASDSRVPLGETVVFSGTRTPAAPGTTVNLRYRRAGRTFRTLAQDTTDAQGDWRIAVRPRRSGRFKAVSPRQSGEPLRSRRVDVDIRARLAIASRAHQLRPRGVRIRGRLKPRGAGRRVVVQRQTGKGWYRVAVARTERDGTWRARWDSPRLGRYVLRARFGGDEDNLGTRAVLGHWVNVYREDHASYYGPGFYGNRTACGQTLRRGTVGVAHKRLACGTRVRFHYRGTTRRITVIDRGPYIDGRRWDLTDAAREKLGFPRGVGEIWASR